MRSLGQFIHRTWRPRAFALGLVVLALAAPAVLGVARTARSRAAKPAQSATLNIKTNKASYLAGETVTISGTGFTPLESVMLQVKHADGTVEIGEGHEAWWVYPDADGTFQASWSIKPGDSAGSKFVVTANSSSGAAAEAAFLRSATISVNPFANHARGKAVVKAGGFNPDELISIQVAGGQVQRIHADENGSATLEVEMTESSAERVSISAKSLDTDLIVVSAVTVNDFNSNGWFSVVDNAFAEDGAPCAPNPPGYCKDDVPLEKDLTRMGRNDGDAAKYKVFMSWNSVTSWTGVGQTGNACALFSNRSDGKIQFVACAAVENDPADPTKLRQVAGSPYAFTCSASKNDRCTQPTPKPINAQTPEVVAGQFGTLAAADLVTPTDPFPTSPGDLDHQDKDTTLEIDILKSFLPASNMNLVNICSYPSAGNGGNNNPFDCVVRPASGFLKIVKNVTNGTATTFDFTATKGSGQQATTVFTKTLSPTAAKSGTDNYSTAVDLGTDYSITEATPTGWQIDSKSCKIGNTTLTTTSITNGLSGITVQSGLITECTFVNSQVQPKLTLIKNVINDNGGAANATDWTLTATGTGGFTNQALSSITTESGYNSSASTGKQTVNIGVQYALSESATPVGYSNGSNTWTCSGGTFSTPNFITLAAGDDVTCRIVNNDIAPTLTLIKNVKNDNGLTNVATEWTFTATGTGGFSNQTLSSIATEQGYNSSASTGQKAVRAAVQYTLSESSTPSGYTGGPNWSCNGGTFVTPNKITLGLADNVTCRFVNDDNAPTRTITSTQSLRLYDSMQIVGFNDPGSNYGQVTFTLYSNVACSTVVGSETVSLTVSNGNASAATSTGIGPITATGTYYWKVQYSGDQYNAASATTCGGSGDEFTTITTIHNN